MVRLSPPLSPANPRRGEADSKGETPTSPDPAAPSTHWATQKKGGQGSLNTGSQQELGLGLLQQPLPPGRGGGHGRQTPASIPWDAEQAGHTQPTHLQPLSSPQPAKSSVQLHSSSRGQRAAAAETCRRRAGGPGSGWPLKPRTVLSRTFRGGCYRAASLLFFFPGLNGRNKAFCKASLEEKYPPPPEPREINK